jgi:TonB family protein
METLMIYILQSGISLMLLYAVYRLFLSSDTFFQTNRIYLIIAVVFSLLVPILPLQIPLDSSNPASAIMLDTFVVNSSKISPAPSHSFDIFRALTYLYLIGAAVFFLRFLLQIGQIFILIHKFGISRYRDCKIVCTSGDYAPFSFFDLIFINPKNLSQESLDTIINHERVHIRQGHTIELLLFELLTVVQWFNPVVWLYRKAIKSVHEYLADEGVLTGGCNRVDYQQMLLRQSTGIQINAFTNNFNHSLIKKRIIMMTKTKSTFLARLKLLLAAPVALLLVVAFTASPYLSAIAQTEKPVSIIPVTQTPDGNQQEQATFTVVEKMPTFVGGDEARMKYLQENITYPEEARNEGIEGTVYVSFVVEANGSTSDVRILRGIGGGCDEEAVRVISQMPAWQPGEQRGEAVRVQFNMPIKFKLGESDKEEQGIELKNPPPPPPPKSSAANPESITPPPPPKKEIKQN